MQRLQIRAIDLIAIRAIGLTAALFFNGIAMAAGATISRQDIDAVVAKLKAHDSGTSIKEAKASELPGIIAIELTNGTVLYASADGRYLIAGDLYALGDDIVNLTETRRDEKRRELIANVALKDMAIFPAKGERRAVVTVFTDVDCGYCRKLHQEVPRLNQMGVEVRYLAYPRAGVGSPSYDKLVTAWCSNDRPDAITRFKRGEELPMKTCDNPVAKEYELGHLAGLLGTPAIVLENGRMLPGYMSAAQLGEVLGI